MHLDQEVRAQLFEHEAAATGLEQPVPERAAVGAGSTTVQPPPDLPVLFDNEGYTAEHQNEDGAELPYEYGAGHGVEVYQSDTIQDFLGKVSLACKELSKRWSQSGRSDAAEMARRYLEASDCAEHVVLGFMPTSSTQQGSSGGESVRSLFGAHDVESNWLPMAPSCTFRDYMARLGLGDGAGMFLPLLRVTRMSRTLRFSNHRLRQFMDDKVALEFRVDGVNDEQRSFAYARYTHAGDGESKEWRPCIAKRLGQRRSEIQWLFSSPSAVSPQGVASADMQPQHVVGESAVLLAAATPEFRF